VKNILRILVLLLLPVITFAQNYQAEYLEAKRQFKLNNYQSARDGFASVIESEIFGAYASFFYALSSYKLGDKKMASDMWKQILAKYSGWDKSQEVYFWLAYSAFEQEDFQNAFSYADKLSPDLRSNMVHSFLSEASASKLSDILDVYPKKEVAEYLLKQLNQVSYNERDQDFVIELTERFNIKYSELTIEGSQFKDNYSVALALPFMFDGLDLSKKVISNTIIFDLYQGMELAKKDLDSMGINLNLYPFDTRKKASATRKLLESTNISTADVIVGPLYSGPNSVMRQFSFENEIPMINPLSSTSDVIGFNQYSFLFNPSNETKGKNAGRYAAKKFKSNKKTFVFYESKRDSIIAANYKNVLEEEGFSVIRFDELSNKDAQRIQIDFTEQFEYPIDSSMVDSISAIPGRFVRSRPLRDRNTGRKLFDEEGNEILEFYEMKFHVEPNSVGHIMVASSSNLLANNFISLAEVRTDSIGIIGYEDWLDFSLINYDQLERIDVSMIGSNFCDKSSLEYKDFRNKCISQLKTEPSKFHIIGYELIWQIGQLFRTYGNSIEIGLRNHSIEGKLLQGLDYGPLNDNQLVPILQLEKLNLINKN